MTLARTALRLAAIEALNEDPTLANVLQGRIDDSRINEIAVGEPSPILLVSAEDDEGTQFSKNNGGPPFDTKCDLILEITVRGLDTTEAGDEVIAYAITDREMESTIDLIEHRAIEVLGMGEGAWATRLRRHVTRRLVSKKSSRFKSDDIGARLATRLVTLSFELKDTEEPFPAEGDGVFACLPDPLRSIAEAMPENSSGYAACLKIAAQYAAIEPPPALDGLAISFVNPSDPTDHDDVRFRANANIPQD